MTETWVTHFRSGVHIYWTGILLFMVWVVEALLVVVFAPIKCCSAVNVPYSEADRKWFHVTRIAYVKINREPPK